MTNARICIKIDVDREYPEAKPIVLDEWKAYLVPAEYNQKPQKFTNYCVFGHTTVGCVKILKPNTNSKLFG